MRVAFLLLLLFTPCFALGQTDSTLLPKFSKPGGVYESGFELTISCEAPNAIIKYTTDGSTPGSGSRTFRGSISISGVHVIRARAYVSGKPGPISTQSYFLGRAYSMPVVSICTDSSNFWSSARGIYVKGTGGLPNYPYRGANYWKNWERVVNMEYYEPDGTAGFNQVVGVKIFGGWSRPLPQKSLAIFSRKRYGKKYIEHKIFRDKPNDKFKSLVLRNSGSDFNKTQFRDAFMTSLVRDVDLEIQAYQPCAVYINGRYWGVQNMREKINEQYLRFNCGADPDSVDMMKHRNDLKAGNRGHYKKMLAYMRSHDLSNQEHFDHVATLMDVNNYAHYNIMETYIDNHDAGGNIRYWRPQTVDGKWRWILFDTDFGFSIGNWKAYKVNTLEMFTDPAGPKWPNPPWSTFIIRKLLENEGFKTHYINQFADHLNTTFHPDTVNNHLDYFQAMYEQEMPYHFERWGGNMKRWHQSIKVMHDFATYRPTYMRKFIMQKFGLSDTSSVKIDGDGSMGSVKLNSIKLKQFPFEGIYFAGNEITITAKPKFGYEFVGWEGHDSKELTLVIDPTEDLDLKAIFKRKDLSPHYETIRINEFAFNQKKGKGFDWIELLNTSSQALDMTGWMFLDAKNKNRFVFPEGTKMEAGAFLVVSQHVDSFHTLYPDSLTAIGPFNFGLSSKGELLRLCDENGMVVDSFSYPAGKKKLGVLAMRQPGLNANQASNWTAHETGTPGYINQVYAEQLQREEEERRQQQQLLIFGGGGLGLVILVFIFLLRRKKKRSKQASTSQA